MATTWDRLAAGQDCPFDEPREDKAADWDLVSSLTVSSWYLPHNQMHRGHGILVFDPRHVTRLDQLLGAEWHSYAADLYRVVRAITSVCKPDHLNVESLGNVVPHLHWHVIPRYKNDGRWGQPIWVQDLTRQPERRLAADEHQSLLAALREAL
jgi:diadenosine tetraphosphate (Ap4A) HIT family hydrolase